MKAMVFAAGRGTRLRPFTDDRPKALVEIEGVTLLEIVLGRLRTAGVTEVVINLHHFGEQIVSFLEQRGNFGLRVHVSWERELLDTGGGLKHAAAWLATAPGGSFLVHNVDVLSDIDLGSLMRTHRESGALATLAAMPRETSRPLLFDDAGWLCGRVTSARDRVVRAPVGSLQRLGFAGIHAVSCALLPLLSEAGAFPIVESYLRLAAEGHPIRAFRADGSRWRDAGRPADLRPLD
jgi:NDP-sugar pyrophosphorylase family protein